MNIQNNIEKETAVQDERQSKNFDNTVILLNIETHLKSIADNLNKITENGIDIFQKSCR